MPHFIFVGERRSNKAIKMGVTWKDGKLAAKTLMAVLESIGLQYMVDYRIVNIYQDRESWQRLDHYDYIAIAGIKKEAAEGAVVIAMGQKADIALIAQGIEHRCMVHPAARGTIRKRANYLAHVKAILTWSPEA